MRLNTKEKIFRLIFPKSFRDAIYNHNIRQYEAREFNRLKSIEDVNPRSELSQVYIANLKLVSDRNALLNLLPKGSIVAVIGDSEGDLSKRILAITKPEKLHLFENWNENRNQESLKSIVENKFKAEISSEQVILHPDMIFDELEKLGSGYFDWVYIDSDPSYEKLTSELEICKLKVGDKGIISGNNYTKGDWLNKDRYGVIEAVHDFCKKYEWEMLFLTHESHRQLSYAIRKINNKFIANRMTRDE